jgi:dTDP-glucose 4,6-dehydratase
VRVLVTGGCGFIGSHLVRRLLAAGDEVVVLDKLTYAGNPANLEGVEHRFVRGDVADPEAVAEAAEGAEAIVNVAAETHVDRSISGPTEFVLTNVLGTQRLVDRARENGVRFVQVSTDEVYGDIEPGRRSSEDDPLRPSSAYAAAKAGGDLLVLAAVRTHGLDATITRGSNTYGPNQFPEKLIPLFVTNAFDGLPLPVYGDGRQRRDWLHVEDHAAAIELVLRAGATGEVYNVAGGEEVENAEIVRRIVELTGCDPALVTPVEDRLGHDRRYALDDAKIHALGWRPRHDLAEGLPATVEWYRTHRAWWEPLKS